MKGASWEKVTATPAFPFYTNKGAGLSRSQSKRMTVVPDGRKQIAPFFPATPVTRSRRSTFLLANICHSQLGVTAAFHSPNAVPRATVNKHQLFPSDTESRFQFRTGLISSGRPDRCHLSIPKLNIHFIQSVWGIDLVSSIPCITTRRNRMLGIIKC